MTDPGSAQFSAEHLKHLEFIQAVISRLGNVSFLIKGCALTLIAAFFGLSLKDDDWEMAGVALVPLVGFWLLDGYFLRQERLFRKLYDQARIPGGPIELFSMSTAPYDHEVRWPDVIRSATMTGFYGTLVLLTVVLVVTETLK